MSEAPPKALCSDFRIAPRSSLIISVSGSVEAADELPPTSVAIGVALRAAEAVTTIGVGSNEGTEESECVGGGDWKAAAAGGSDDGRGGGCMRCTDGMSGGGRCEGGSCGGGMRVGGGSCRCCILICWSSTTLAYSRAACLRNI